MKDLRERRDELAKEIFGHRGVGYGTMSLAVRKVIDKHIALEDRLANAEQEELTIYGYVVIGSDGESCLGTDVLTQQDAIDRAAEWSKDAKNLDIAYSYKVAAIVDQGGL